MAGCKLFCRMTVFLLLVAPFLHAQPPAVLENPAARLSFSGDTGGLTALEDLAAGHDHLAGGAPGALWMLVLDNVNTVEPSQAGSFSVDSAGVPASLELRWSDFGHAELPDLMVTVRVSMDPAEPVIRWRARVSGLGGKSAHALVFPRIAGLAPQSGEEVAVPVWMGERTRRAREVLNPAAGGGRRRDWEYPGLLSMQWIACYANGGPGLLLSTNDTTALRRQFGVFGDGLGGLGLDVTHYPAKAGEDVFEPPYDVVLRLFQGDWFTAAFHYRDWAKDQPWVRESRRRQNASPDWVGDTGLWVWNRGKSPGVLGPARVLQEAAGMPVSVFWHWWHGCAYDTNFPEYLPPREGAAPFRDAVAAAHEAGLHAIVYMNQRLWGMTAQSWTDEGAERFAVKRPDGSVTPEVYNTFNRAPCASMCMGTEFWRNKYAGLAAEAVADLGVDGIYMDQACSSLACYDSAHGHPPGGGAWWMGGFQKLAADIRARTAPLKSPALAGEGCGEAWLPHLDLMLSLQVSMERYATPGEWEPVPLFQAVYNDCATLYGNYASLTHPPYDELWPAEFAPEKPLEPLDRKFSAQFRMEQARAFVWGQQPCLANFKPELLDLRREEMDYVLRIARLRRAALKYLRDGVMLRPPDTGAPEVEIPISRLSIYAGQRERVREYAKTVPSVLAAAWRASDGGVAVMLANITDDSVPVAISLNSPDYSLSENGVINELTTAGAQPVGEFQEGRAELTVKLEPQDLRVMVLEGR
ncbi:MAG: hypothetical protein H3C30_09085 [Candidatus Hydrogenedentes bacterium]|nr:hypothetical protein [Candidatus Hydrogenedentota bacterium]